MTYRLQNLMLAMLLALTTLFVGFGTLSQNPMSGGYQLFERAASGHQANIQLVLLGNFAPPPETASECCNAPNTGLTATQRQGILREASQLGQGNLTLAGRATRAEAADLGEAWVGPGYRTASDGRTLVSGDGTRTFRPPTPKPNSPFSETGVQVNFETRELIDGRWTVRSNAHLDVSD